MIQKNLVKLEHTVGEKVYQFIVDPDSPLKDVKDALMEFLGHIVGIENQIKAQQAASIPAPSDPPTQPEEVK